MNLTEKYRPKTEEEFVGDKESLKRLDDYVEAYHPVILVGPPGIGKTSSAYIIARKYNYQVEESNASDDRASGFIDSLKSSLLTNSIIPTLFLIDEADGISRRPVNCQKKLAKLLEKTSKPIILTANDEYALDDELKKVCKVIKMRPPRVEDVVELLRDIAEKEKVRITFEETIPDIRASINNAFGKGDKYESEINDFEKTKRIFRTGETLNIEPVWLVDNVSNFYKGLDIYKVIKNISLSCRYRRKEFLSCMPKSTSGQPSFPEYFKKFKK